MVIFLVLEHIIDNPCDFMRRSGDGFGRPRSEFEASVEGTQGTVGLTSRLGGQSQSGVGPVLRFARLTAEQLAARDVVLRTHSQPGSEMFARFPFAHVSPDFGQDGQGQDTVYTINGGQADCAGLVQTGAQVEIGAIAPALEVLFSWPQGLLVNVHLGGEGGVELLNLGMTLSQLAVVEVIQLDRLPEGKNVFRAIIARQGFSNLFSVALAARVTELCQGDRVFFSADNCSDDLQAGLASDVAKHIGQLNVHQLQSLLNVLDVGCPIAQKVLALTDIGPQGSYLGTGTKGALQETIGVQLLDPLTIQGVRLAPGNILDVVGIDQQYFKPTHLQNLKDGYPEHGGTLHRHRLHPALLQPIGQSMQFTGEGLEAADRLLSSLFRHGHPNLRRTDVQPGSIEVDLLESFQLDDLLRGLLLASAASHITLLWGDTYWKGCSDRC